MDIAGELRRASGARVECGAATRAAYASDASNYRVPPVAVVFPRDADQVKSVLAAAVKLDLSITARGAGTSCAGNSIGPGIVLDLRRYFNQVIEVNPDKATARVQPGVVLDALQAAARPFGLRFGPDPSSHSRCTIGGMIGNNACGAHALAYGRTADNVIGLDWLTGDGRRLKLGRGFESVPGLTDLVQSNLALIRTEFGRFGRQGSGYNLAFLLPENGFDMAKALVGSEGSCGLAVEAEVRLVPIATDPVLVILAYPDLIAAAAAVPTLLRHAPRAIEAFDSDLVELVRQRRRRVPDLPPGGAWLLVEVAGDSRDMTADAEALASRILPPGPAAAEIWRLRDDGAGWAGRSPAGRPAWPGWEDAAVPPANLAAYLLDFAQLRASHGLGGLLYGHFGDGCVHTRLDFDWEDDQGSPVQSSASCPPPAPRSPDPDLAHRSPQLRQFVQAATELVISHGGVPSGEHGDGRARSELLASVYSPAALTLMGQFKGLFDPANRLNPGVLFDPLPLNGDRLNRRGLVAGTPPNADRLGTGPAPLDANLRRPSAQPHPARPDGFVFSADDADLTTALHRCVGLGKCQAAEAAFCPSFASTGEELDSTRGRARVFQELTRLRQLTVRSGGGQGESLVNWSDLESALDRCLACKACSAQCPAGVDMARYKSEVLARRHGGHIRPRSHYALGWLPRWTRLAANAPGLANTIVHGWLTRGIIRRLAGIEPSRKLPRFAPRSFQRALARRKVDLTPRAVAPDQPWMAALAADGGRGLVALGVEPVLLRTNSAGTESKPTDQTEGPTSDINNRPPVILWVDSFTDAFAPKLAQAAVRLLDQAGYAVFIAPSAACCGLTWINTGQLAGARAHLTELYDNLAPFAACAVPIIGLEPSCLAVLRGDALDLMAGDPRAALVAANVHTLAELLTAAPPLGPVDWSPPNLTGRTVIVQPHCHHQAVMGFEADLDLLKRTGARIQVLDGCCGLAGSFGFERGHRELSQAVAERSLLPALRAATAGTIFLADGLSCRTQAADLADRPSYHLAELMLSSSRAGAELLAKSPIYHARRLPRRHRRWQTFGYGVDFPGRW